MSWVAMTCPLVALSKSTEVFPVVLVAVVFVARPRGMRLPISNRATASARLLLMLITFTNLDQPLFEDSGETNVPKGFI